MKTRNKGLLGIVLAGAMLVLPMTRKADAEPVTNLDLTMTNNATLTWNWMPQYRLNTTSDVNGSVTGNTNGWYDENTSISLNAMPDRDYNFAGWTGDTNTLENPLNLNITNKYDLTANFEVKKTTNNVPYDFYRNCDYTNDITDQIDLEDWDGDGLTNWKEYHSATDPTNINSVLEMIYTGVDSNGNHIVEWRGGRDARQYLEKSEDLLSDNWSKVYTNNTPTDITNSVLDMDTSDGKTYFYRIKAERE